MAGLLCRTWNHASIAAAVGAAAKAEKEGKTYVGFSLSPDLQPHTEGREYNLQVSVYL